MSILNQVAIVSSWPNNILGCSFKFHHSTTSVSSQRCNISIAKLATFFPSRMNGLSADVLSDFTVPRIPFNNWRAAVGSAFTTGNVSRNQTGVCSGSSAGDSTLVRFASSLNNRLTPLDLNINFSTEWMEPEREYLTRRNQIPLSSRFLPLTSTGIGRTFLCPPPEPMRVKFGNAEIQLRRIVCLIASVAPTKPYNWAELEFLTVELRPNPASWTWNIFIRQLSCPTSVCP